MTAPLATITLGNYANISSLILFIITYKPIFIYIYYENRTRSLVRNKNNCMSILTSCTLLQVRRLLVTM